MIALDIYLTNFIFNLPHPLITVAFFSFFSLQGVGILLWIVIFLYLVVVEEKRHHSFIYIFIASLILAVLFSQIIFKNVIRRNRPRSELPILSDPPSLSASAGQAWDPTVHPSVVPTGTKAGAKNTVASGDYPADYSFPSSHATIAFAVATVLAYFDKKRTKLFFAIAVLIAFSRVYLGYHYVFDIIAGGALGWGISQILLYETKRSTTAKT